MVPLRRLLSLPAFSDATVVAGRQGLDALVSLVTVGEVPDGPAFLRGGELVLTTFFAQRDDVPGALRAYRSAGAVGIVFKRSEWLDGLPPEAVAFSESTVFPLVEVPRERRWPQLIEASLALLKRRRALPLRRRVPPPPGREVDAFFHSLGGNELRHAADRLLAPLVAHDADRGSQLVATLLAFLEHRQNACETAAALFLHRNSLAYRLRRIRRLTGLDFRDARACLAWHVALVLRESGRESTPRGRRR
jgi:DNA-binding PucR family transcriptional regulator